MTEIEKRAAEVVRHAYDTGPKYHTDHIVTALSAVGLLRTGLEQRAIEACKAYARDFDDGSPTRSGSPGTVRLVGRDALAAEKPPERWSVVGQDQSHEWVVGQWSGVPGRFGPAIARFTIESDARDYCARKNESQP